MSINRWLSGSITLTKLKSVITEKTGKDGKPVKGIFIPFDANYITVKEKAAYLNIRVGMHSEPDQFDQDAMITQNVPSNVYKEATEEQKEEFKKLPILGNLRDWSSGGNSENDSAPEVGEDDDLPF
jgi:hypothetical protein